MENLPEDIVNSKKPMKIDLILGGGAFNGSYILGALYFLKEMERKKYIVIRRISTCSISSILAILYLTDNLDRANELYFDIIEDLKDKGNLSKLLDLKNMIKNHISHDKLVLLNKKIYICYNDVTTFKKQVVVIEKILKKYKEDRGIIHTSNYEISKWINETINKHCYSCL